MTISSAMNAGVAGLQSNATRLASVSDNIANSSTMGYKRVETDFHSMVIASTGGIYSAGGVRATTQRFIDGGGALISSSNATDIAVQGRGYIPVARESEINSGNENPDMLLTTTGSFRTDADGYLRSPAGLILMGWPATQDGIIPTFPRDTDDGLTPVQINANQFIGVPTTRMNLGVNLPATGTTAGSSGVSEEMSLEYFDNLGNSESLNMTFTPTVPTTGASNEWTVTMFDSVDPATAIGTYRLTFNDNRTAGGTLAAVDDLSSGTPVAATLPLFVNVAGGPIELNIGEINSSTGFTQLSDSFAPLNITKDGSPAGTMTSVEVDSNGFVTANFDTGITRIVFQVPLVDLPNPNGMLSLDNQTYKPSNESGAFFMWDAGTGPTGEIVGFAQEESTTDVAAELTTMIRTQRAYSSNAKVIQTVDEMLQETTNIKR